MSTNPERLKSIIEGALLAAGRPLSIDHILSLFLDDEQPSRDDVRAALDTLSAECEQRGVELKEVSSGFRFQVKTEYAEWVSRLWEEKPTRYSRATLETLALIAYRQPITRGEIEEIRGVSVSSNIVKGLLEREWVKVVGHRDVPGKPALFATTRQFLDYFNLKGLSDLPPLAEIRSIDSIEQELNFGEAAAANEGENKESGDDDAIGTAALDLGDAEVAPNVGEGDVETDKAKTETSAEETNGQPMDSQDAAVEPVNDAEEDVVAETIDAAVVDTSTPESKQDEETVLESEPNTSTQATFH